MKLLSIVWFKVLPARFGGQKGTALFNEYLGRDAELVCLASKDNEADSSLSYQLRAELPVGKRTIFSPVSWKKIRSVALKERPTHILLEYPYHAGAAAAACKGSGAKLILHTHNIEYRRFRDMGKKAWQLLRRYERWAHRRADLVLFKTESDARIAQQDFGIAANKCMIVPYGIETTEGVNSNIPQEPGIAEETTLLLFAGTLDYPPNALAVEAIYKELAPKLDVALSDYRILICGRNRQPDFDYLKKMQHPCVIQLGEVDSLQGYYAAAHLFINPVLSGGGVQTKNIDALAANCTTVAFNFAAQGINLSLTGAKLRTVADGDWNAFVQGILQALEHTENTPPAFFDYYSWQRIAARVLERIKQL